MSKEELDYLMKEIETKTEEIKHNPSKANDLLVRAGIYTAQGNLSQEYQSK